MPTSEGITDTHRAPRYLAQLCKHMTNRGFQVETTDDNYGFADFGFGTCVLHADPQQLVMNLATQDPVTLERAQRALTRDIERFGRRDGLTITWRLTQ
ncbi:MAG: DUF2218 domain-containing protein [Pseudonocardiaceae bacterium]|nr:DUF2218 domain-containing protein [Pseudonocardiaceae bacterium]